MPPPLSVDEALARILAGVAPMPAEAVAVEAAHRRTLGSAAGSAPHAATVRRLSHGRLRGALR